MGKIIKKAICYFGGMFLIAFGIRISALSATGISPVSSIPRACEKIFAKFGIEGISLGMSTSMIYIILIILQIIILRKKYKPIQLLQFGITFILSYFIDICLFVNNFLPKPSNYFIQLLYLVISIAIIAIGVAFYLMPKWIPLPAEGLSAAISEASDGKIAFHNAKSRVDTSMVIVAAVLAFALLGGVRAFTDPNIVVVREGTIAAAIFVGKGVGIINKAIKEKVVAWIDK